MSANVSQGRHLPHTMGIRVVKREYLIKAKNDNILMGGVHGMALFICASKRLGLIRTYKHQSTDVTI